MTRPAWIFRGIKAALLAAFLVAGPLGVSSAADGQLRRDCAVNRQKEGGWIHCKRAVGAFPADPEVRRNFAISLAYGGRYDAATEQFHEVARLAPKSPRAQYEVAWIHAFKGEYGPAAAPIERAMALRPRTRKYMQLAAIIYASTKQYAKRFALISAIAAMGDQISMFELAFMYADGTGTRRDLAQAVVWLTRAAQKGHVVAMDKLADAYLNGKLGLTRNRKMADYWARRAHKARED